MDLVSGVALSDDAWHRIGFTWDGLDRVLYVDDMEVARDTQVGLEGLRGAIHMGAGSDLAHGTFWSGLIDDVRVYDRVIVPWRRRGPWQPDKRARPCPAGLVVAMMLSPA